MPDQKQVTSKRIQSFDFLRGVALMLIIFFHSSIYNYANIHKIDFDNPPLMIVLMSFMALWGGIFIVYSMAVNAIMSLRRLESGFNAKIFIHLAQAGGALVIFHYILNIFLGRWSNDFINNRPDMTVVAGSLRSMHFTFPHIAKFFEGSSLSTIAFNLLILSGAMFFMFGRAGLKKEKRNYILLWLSGLLVMALSFFRVDIFPLLAGSIGAGNYAVASFFGFFIANPYPLLPYLAYGIFGLIIGMIVYRGRTDLLAKTVIPGGILLLLYGLFGMTKFDKTISTPDYFWYFKTNFELGLFLLAISLTYIFIEPRANFLNKVAVIRWFSRISLTVYMLETFTSEILRMAMFRIKPSWDQTINGCLVFGVVNIIFWVIAVILWRKIDFKYTLEYYGIKLFNVLGKKSTKLDNL